VLNRIAISIVLLALCLTWPVQAQPQPQPKFRVAYDEATAPLVPVMKAAYAEIGIQPEFVLAPAERALLGASEGSYDADLSRVAGSLGAYPKLMFTREPIKKTELLPYVRIGSQIRIQSVVDLRRYKVGLMRGAKFAESYVSKTGLSVQTAPHPASFLKMLEAGRFDVALLTSTQLSSQQAMINLVAIQAGPALATAYSYHVLNVRHAALAEKLDAALRSMKADGRLSVLLAPK
jgi:ABC-type amino acid transport substrate-binding protein